MTDDPESGKKKTRTRQHIIADLAVNHIERHVLLAGFTLERIIHDYGMDLIMTTYDSDGSIENDLVWFQVKATDNLQLAADDSTATVRIESADLRYWLMQLMPVILVLYDAKNDRALWVETQEYVKRVDIDADEIGETVTMRLPMINLLTKDAIRFMRERKEIIRARFHNLNRLDPIE